MALPPAAWYAIAALIKEIFALFKRKPKKEKK